tara:strand:- start:591 stop:842 length:252 start_codon:yes stop_codon:yes gene_type:complete
LSKYDDRVPEMTRLHAKGFGHQAIAIIMDIPVGSLSGYFRGAEMRPVEPKCRAHKLEFNYVRGFKHFTIYSCAEGCRLQQAAK